MKKILYFIAFLTFPAMVYSQLPGEIDTTFGTPIKENFYTSGIAYSLHSKVLVQPDGKLILGSDLFEFNSGHIVLNVTRLNENDTFDSLGFDNNNPGLDEGYFHDLALQSDGKILVAGQDFDTSLSNHNLIRLNSDRTIDTSFHHAVYQGPVWTMVPQQNGKILVGGNFATVDGIMQENMVRVNFDGTRDSTFDIRGLNYSVKVITDDTINDRIFAAGPFTQCHGEFYNGLVALKYDGSLDTSWHNPGITNIVDLSVDGTGKLLVATKGGIRRLNIDGTNDTSFDIGTVTGLGYIYDIALDQNGKILVAGTFSEFKGINQHTICRLLSDGNIDTTFWSNYRYPNTGGQGIYSIAIESTGNIVCRGSFYTYENFERWGIMRLEPDGYLHYSFIPKYGLNKGCSSCYPNASDIAVQQDGKILVGGDFAGYDGYSQEALIRLETNGRVDTSFNTQLFYSGRPAVGQIVIDQAIQKIYVLGSFSGTGSFNQSYILRLNFDGSPDTTFVLDSTIVNNGFHRMALQPDGKLILTGNFLTFGSPTSKYILRIDATGAIDPTFNPGVGFNPAFLPAIVLQPDGKIVVGGDFSSYDGHSVNNIVRINTDGSYDSTFVTGTGFSNRLTNLILGSNGNIIAGGYFSLYNGNSSNLIASIRSNGDFDSTFMSTLNSGSGHYISAMLLQSDGKIVTGGFFNAGNYSGLARLNLDGTIDSSIFIQSYPGAGGGCFSSDASGRLLMGGAFNKYDGYLINCLTRIYMDNLPNVIIDPEENYEVIVYPNPTSNHLTLDLSKVRSVSEIRIIDMNGRILKNIKMRNQFRENLNIDLSEIPSGLYILTGVFDDKRRSVRFNVVK